MPLPLHRLEYVVHASGLAEINIICDALAWLVGDERLVAVEETKSFHNSPLYIITATSAKKGDARRALPRLGERTLSLLAGGLELRLDEENNLHFRLSLDELVAGEIVLISATHPMTPVKAKCKLEVYPRDTPLEVAATMLADAAEVARRRNLPEKPPLYRITDEEPISHEKNESPT